MTLTSFGVRGVVDDGGPRGMSQLSPRTVRTAQQFPAAEGVQSGPRCPLLDSSGAPEGSVHELSRRPLRPKVCHRRAPNVWVESNHAVRSSGRLPRTKTSTRLQIFHFPERSYQQFERKIRQGALAWTFVYDKYLSKGEIRLRDYYRSLSEGDDADWILDTRLRNYMSALYAQMDSE